MLLFREKKPKSSKTTAQADLDFEIRFFRGLVKRDPKCVEALQILGDAYTKTGQWKRGLQIDRKLAQLCPTNPLVFYNLACSLALLEQIDDAFVALQKAVALGYRDLRWMLKDPDLANIRKDQRFREIRRALRRRKPRAS